MSVTRQPVPARQVANRGIISDIPYSVAFNQYTYSSQNCRLDVMDEFMLGLDQDFSIGFRVKGSDLLTIPAYIFGNNTNAGSIYCLVGVNRTSAAADAGKINLQLRDTSGRSLGVKANTPLLNGKWHFVRITKNSDNNQAGIHTYIDGVEATKTSISTGAFSGTAVSDRPAMLGSSAGSSNFFKGLISQFGIWQRILTDDEDYNWRVNNVIPDGYYRYYSCNDSVLTTQLTESATATHGLLDSVNMWTNQSPRGGRKLINK